MKTTLENVTFRVSYPDISRSDEYYCRAENLIPGATQTLAKGPTQYVCGVAPKYLERGFGSHVWDVDGNRFIDYSMAVGPVSLGYCYQEVDSAIRQQLLKGISFSLMHPLEVELAELLRTTIPNAEMVRYSKTGADVTSAAVRLARAYTNRNKVLCCGYHGWHDWYVSVTTRNQGIPEEVRSLTHTFEYNNIDSLYRALDEDTACVILEPVTFQAPENGFLDRVRHACTENGTLLIFDEMWTGFRMAIGGAQEYFHVDADLATFSKAVANGMPLSILTGKKDVMKLCDQDIFFYTTFGGETLSLTAAVATIKELRRRNVPAHIARLSGQLRDGYNEIARNLGMHYTRCIGLDYRTMVVFDSDCGNQLEMKSLVQQELIKHGILWNGFHNISYSHTDEDIKYTLAAYEEALQTLREAVLHNRVTEMLRGTPVQPPFRKSTGFHTKPAL